MPLNKHLMAEMTWPELKMAVGEGRIAVMPAGIIEQHGPALPLDTDIFLADEITRRAAARVPDKVVLVPPIVHGHSPHHMDFPGTVTDLMMVGTAVLPLRLWWSSFSREGIYGIVQNASAEKGKLLVAAAVEGLAKIFVQFHEKQIPKRVDHH